MAASNRCFALCTCLFLGLSVSFIILLIVWIMLSSGTVSTSLQFIEDSSACNDIQLKEPFMMKISNLTVQIGSPAQIDCKVVQYTNDKKISWKGPRFQAMSQSQLIASENGTTTISRPQKGVHVIGRWTSETFYCGGRHNMSGKVTPLVEIFTLVFDPVHPDHGGWYTCSSNFTNTGNNENGEITGEKTYFLEERFYLSVV